jgi:hypothetical protein
MDWRGAGGYKYDGYGGCGRISSAALQQGNFVESLFRV